MSSMIQSSPVPLEAELGLSQVVEAKLESYLAALNGDKPASGLYDHIIREVERPLLAIALKISKNNKVKAAQILGINRNTLRKKLQTLGLE